MSINILITAHCDELHCTKQIQLNNNAEEATSQGWELSTSREVPDLCPNHAEINHLSSVKLRVVQ